MELTKKDTKMLQGLAVLAMVWLHLFARNDFVGLYHPLIFIDGTPISFYIAQLSDFCVMCFAFCSGYAHMHLSAQPDYYRERLKGLLRLFVNYWIILILFSIVSAAYGKGEWMPGSVVTFIGNALLYNISYNGAWWYLYAYVFVVILSPIILKAVKNLHPILVLAVGFMIYCAAYYVRFNVPTTNLLFSKIGPIGMTLFEYVIGCVWYKTKLFSKCYRYWKKLHTVVRLLLALAVIAGMLYVRTKIVPSLFVAPATGIVIITLFHFWKKPLLVQKEFLTVGKHSTNIWLTHMFFYAVLFDDFVYIVKYPLFVFALMVAITLLLSLMLQTIQKQLTKRLVS